MKHVPLRTCIVCRASKDKSELVRVVKTPDGKIVPDGTGKLSGRGAYVCAGGNCLEKAIGKQLFNRAFKQTLPQSVYIELATATRGQDGK